LVKYVLIAYYREIIAKSSYALGNMRIYSQVTNMIWIIGIWITTQYENIISPLYKDKLPITNMQIALKQYPGFDQSQTMRGKVGYWRW
jgi:hypothetical protein